MDRLARLDRRQAVALGVLAFAAGIALVAMLVAVRGSSEGTAKVLDPSVVPSVPPAVAASAQPDRRLPTSDAPIARLVIPATDIDQAPVEGRVDPATNTMIAPEGPFDIAYYSYSARPGKGNAVFSGHLDYVKVGPAVFWNLRNLKEGDDILVRLTDGLELRYKVAFNVVYSADNGPWDRLFAADAAPDAVTLYTCDGKFDQASANYNERRVVRAIRVG